MYSPASRETVNVFNMIF